MLISKAIICGIIWPYGKQAAFSWTALGAALFLLSDLTLADQLFSKMRFRCVGDIVWLTDGLGQMLIVFRTGSALLEQVGNQAYASPGCLCFVSIAANTERDRSRDAARVT
ncbi:MAG: lysoplasmalogenase family protein [Aggregatilineales bacterium]